MDIKTTIFKCGAAVVAIFSFAMFPQLAKAQCTVDQNQPAYDGGTSERNLAGYYEWESFTAGVSGSLCEIDLMFCNTSTKLNGTGTLNIYTGTGIGGTLLATQSVTVNGTGYATNTVFWQQWTITTPPFVATGNVYTFQFVPTVGGGLPDPYLIEINIPDVYAGGHNYGLGTGGCCTFATYVDGSVLSVPNSSDPSKNYQLLLQNVPTHDELKGEIKSPEGAQVQVEIYDLQGRKLTSQQMAITKGSNLFNIDLKTIANGAYFIRISGASMGQLTKKFIKI